MLHIEFVDGRGNFRARRLYVSYETLELGLGHVIETVKETFSRRHVYCHQVSSDQKMDAAIAQRIVLFVWDFLATSELVINGMGRGHTNQT